MSLLVVGLYNYRQGGILTDCSSKLTISSVGLTTFGFLGLFPSVIGSSGRSSVRRTVKQLSVCANIITIIIIIIMIIIIIIIIIGNPQLVVQLPPQSTTHKTLGVMIDKDVSGKLALPQFFATEKKDRLTRKDCNPVSSI